MARSTSGCAGKGFPPRAMSAQTRSQRLGHGQLVCPASWPPFCNPGGLRFVAGCTEPHHFVDRALLSAKHRVDHVQTVLPAIPLKKSGGPGSSIGGGRETAVPQALGVDVERCEPLQRVRDIADRLGRPRDVPIEEPDCHAAAPRNVGGLRVAVADDRRSFRRYGPHGLSWGLPRPGRVVNSTKQPAGRRDRRKAYLMGPSGVAGVTGNQPHELVLFVDRERLRYGQAFVEEVMKQRMNGGAPWLSRAAHDIPDYLNGSLFCHTCSLGIQAQGVEGRFFWPNLVARTPCGSANGIRVGLPAARDDFRHPVSPGGPRRLQHDVVPGNRDGQARRRPADHIHRSKRL